MTAIFNPPYRYEYSQHGPVTIYDSIGVGWIARVKESLPHKEALAAAMVEGLNAAAESRSPTTRAAVPPPKALDCSRPSVEALEAERDDALATVRAAIEFFAVTFSDQEPHDPVEWHGGMERNIAMCPVCRYYAAVAALDVLAAAEAERDQAIKERDRLVGAAWAVVEEYQPVLLGTKLDRLHSVLCEILRSALAGVPGGGQEAEQEDLGGGAAARSKGEKT